MTGRAPVALVHDYLTQRGGAERVVLAMTETFPDAPLYTSLYEPGDTYPEFGAREIHTTWLSRVGAVRRHHRLAFPVLAPVMSRFTIDADVAICSSSGWAHGAHVTGHRIVYCHAPARWLYQRDRYVGDDRARAAALARSASGPSPTTTSRSCGSRANAATTASTFLYASSRDTQSQAPGSTPTTARVAPVTSTMTGGGSTSASIP